METPRPLTVDERALLEFLLGLEFPGVEAFREQARHARETGGEPCSCGCPSFGLIVDRSLADRAELASDVPFVVSSAWELPDGTPGGDCILFQEDGWLEAVEITYYGDEPPSTLPPPSLCHRPEGAPGLFWGSRKQPG
jgi:hypothetical protein